MRKQTGTALASAYVEKDIENAYRAEVSYYRSSAAWTSPHGTDGLATWTRGPATVRLLLEAKYDRNLKDRAVACGVLGQVLLYLKRFERAGDAMPNVLLVGDRDECFVLATTAVQRFMDLDVDWGAAPSTGDPELTRALVQGVDVMPYVRDVSTIDFGDLVSEVETLAQGRLESVEATESNLAAIFAYWRDNVFKEGRGAQALTPVEQVDVFLRCLFQPEDVSPHGSRRGVLCVPGYPDGVLVNQDLYGSFFSKFRQGYRASQVANFMGMRDQLVEDDARRRQGAFFTPRLWVDEAHREVTRVLGDGWRKDCVVWDCAAGTANLTRDYNDWGLLVSSTAERADVGAMRQHGWGGHYVFQYDWLNPGVESPFFEEHEHNLIPPNADKALRKAAKEGRRLVFLMNPPYGTAGDAGAKGTSKEGIAQTLVNGLMKAAKMGACSQQLYAQFMFRCAEVAREYGFKEYTVALFSKPTFMSSGSYRPFREWWYGKHTYQGGFLFQASHFADVSGRWGVSFTVWSSGGVTPTSGDLPVRLCDLKDFSVMMNAMKHIYNADGREASEWVRTPVKGLKGVDAPQMSSGLKSSTTAICLTAEGQLFTFLNDGNNLQASGTNVALLPNPGKKGNNERVVVLKPNWRRAVALYAARKLVAGDWINDKDEYLAPNESLPGYGQWVDDAHAYALLHASNNCTAMRDVQYKGKSWRIKNHWFWRTRDESLKALDTKDTPTLYRDCKSEPIKPPDDDPLVALVNESPWEQTGDPYFAHVLPTLKLSPDARKVLDLLDALWIKSLPLRENYAAGKPELHLMAWDAGIYQLKHIFRDLFPDDWKALQEAHKVLANRLREGVYRYGFLQR